MASLNKVLLMGNLTRDPELRYIPSGTAVTSFTIAVNRIYNSPTGERKEEVCFVRIVVWGRMAEVSAEYLSKGSSVFVEGRLQSRSWEAQDGQKRSTIEVIANNIQFLNRKGQQTQKFQEGNGQGAPAADEVGSIDMDAQGMQGNTQQAPSGDDEVPF